MSDIIITQTETNGVVILEVVGKITRDLKTKVDTVGEFRLKVREVLASGKNKIILDLNGLRYIDSSGIGELVSSFVACKNAGGRLKITRLTQKIHDLLAMTKLLQTLETFDSNEDAIKSFATASTS